MTIHEYLLLLRRRWWLLASAAAVGVVLAGLWTASMPRTFTTGATVIVTAASAEGVTSSADLQRVGTLAALASTDAIVEPAATTIGVDPGVLRGSVTAAARSGTTLIDVSSSAGSPEDAALRANAVADALVSSAGRASGSNGTVILDVVSRAGLPSAPTSPRPRSNLAIGMIIGLAIGVGAIVVMQSIDTRIRSSADLPHTSRLMSVTSLPLQRGRSGKHDARLESFRQLRANLQFGSAAEGTIAIAGITGSQSTTDIAQQLARVLGEIGVKVVIIDADLSVPTPHQSSSRGVAGQQMGLSDVLRGESTLLDVAVAGDVRGVTNISAGRSTSDSAPLLSTTAMGDALAELRQRFDFVLLVCPPVLKRSDTSVVAVQSGNSLLVVDAGRTTRGDLQQALELLEAVGSGSVSLVIDGATWRPGKIQELRVPQPAHD